MNSSPRDFLGYGRDLPSTAWPGGAGLAVSIVVNFEEGSERSPGRGDALAEPSGESEPVAPGIRNRKNESLFAYGSRAGFWRVLAILDRYDIKATVFACATALELNPVAATAISRGGHEVCSHGLRWMPMNSLDAARTASAHSRGRFRDRENYRRTAVGLVQLGSERGHAGAARRGREASSTTATPSPMTSPTSYQLQEGDAS